MKQLTSFIIVISCLLMTNFATAAVITITLDQVPTDLNCDTECECNQTWVVSDVVLSVTSTTPADDCALNECYWEHGYNSYGDIGVLLNPGRLIVDLGAIDDRIIQIGVDLVDYCSPPTGCTSASIYNGATLVAVKTSAQEGPIGGPGYYIFHTVNKTIDKLIVASCNGHVDEIIITIASSPMTTATCTPSCDNTFGTCGAGCGATYNTCGAGCEGTYNTCGTGCGGTLSTCGGWGCETFFTCGSDCVTYSTCLIDCGSTTLNTCGINCGTTFSTCDGIGCGTTFNARYPEPTEPPAF